MPFYIYECEKCGARTDLFRKVDDRDEPVKCEHCEGGECKRALPSANPIKVNGASYKNGYIKKGDK